MTNIREQLNEVLCQEGAGWDTVRSIGRIAADGAAHVNPVVGLINKVGRWYHAPSKSVTPKQVTPKTVPSKSGEPKKSEGFTGSHAIGATMLATGLGLGAHHLYKKWKTNKTNKKKQELRDRLRY